MDASVRLGRVAGIEVGVHWSLAIVFVLIAWTLAGQVFPAMVPDQPQSAYWLISVLAVLLFYISLLSHEMGHALVARRLGVSVEGITLWVFGGVARLSGDAATAGAETRIAIAGPVVSLVLAIAFGAVTFALDAGGPPLIEGACAWLAFSNGTLLIFNLIPAFPLDGGRILRAWLWRRSGDRYRATATAARLSRVFAFLMIGLGLLALVWQGALSGLWLTFLGVFLLSASRNEASQVLLLGALSGMRVADVMSRDPVVAPGWITVDEFMKTYIPTQRAAVAYPLRSFDGVLDGMVTLTRLAEVPPEQRHATRVRDVGVGLDQVARAAPSEPVSAVVGRFARSADGQVLVVDGGRLVGLLSPTDITRALAAAGAGARS
jgi:Zn-dependent protease